jgi:hypothetical protein
MRSMVEGACGIEDDLLAEAPSTARSLSSGGASRRPVGAVPLPRFAGQDNVVNKILKDLGLK